MMHAATNDIIYGINTTQDFKIELMPLHLNYILINIFAHNCLQANKFSADHFQHNFVNIDPLHIYDNDVCMHACSSSQFILWLVY